MSRGLGDVYKRQGICTLEKAMIKENAAKNVERTMEQLCALLGFIHEKTK